MWEELIFLQHRYSHQHHPKSYWHYLEKKQRKHVHDKDEQESKHRFSLTKKLFELTKYAAEVISQKKTKDREKKRKKEMLDVQIYNIINWTWAVFFSFLFFFFFFFLIGKLAKGAPK